jgi:hypothetical protein
MRSSAMSPWGWLLTGAAAAACAACGAPGDTQARFGGGGDGTPTVAATSAPLRPGSVVVEACSLDQWQSDALSSPSMHALVQTVILLCPTARTDGTVAPVDQPARDALAAQVATIRSQGYRVTLALTMADELDQPYPADAMAASLASSEWRTSVASAAAVFASTADGLDLQLPPPPDASVDDVSALVSALSSAVGRASLSVFVPPGGASNDVAGSGAFDLAAIGRVAARIHVATLDYSCCSGSPGPTIDPGWAVDALRSAASQTSLPLDVAVPLYGWDFGPQGQRAVTFDEATGVAAGSGTAIHRGPTGAEFYDWQDTTGGAHETWFDDAVSTSWTLAAWDTQTLPADVGVVYWGLGSEDPTLWDTLALETGVAQEAGR